jgi:hypothetical protein
MGQLSTQSLLHPLFHPNQQVDRPQVIKNQTIPHHLSKLVFSNQRLLFLVKHRQHQVSSAQVHADVQRLRGDFSQRQRFRIRDPAKDLLGAD